MFSYCMRWGTRHAILDDTQYAVQMEKLNQIVIGMLGSICQKKATLIWKT